MKFKHGEMRRWALPLVAAGLCAMLNVGAHARDANELMLKAVGTTEGVSPVIVDQTRCSFDTFAVVI